ncbi:MAG: hypothetical protein WD652_05890 [Acidimicrobiia bacterium]
MDGHQQRRALTAAEQALQALKDGDPAKASEAAERAAELDQVGAFTGLVEAVDSAATEIDTAGAVSRSAWQRLSATLGPGPLQAVADLAAENA